MHNYTKPNWGFSASESPFETHQHLKLLLVLDLAILPSKSIQKL